MSVHEISVWQSEVRKPFDSVGLVCSCGKAVAGMEGVVTACKGCGTAFIVSVMVLKPVPPTPGSLASPPGEPPPSEQDLGGDPFGSRPSGGETA